MDRRLFAIKQDLLRNPSSSLREWWWCTEEPLLIITECLKHDRYAVIDDFIPSADAKNLCSQVRLAEEQGHLATMGAIGGGQLGRDMQKKEVNVGIRGDSIGYFDGDEQIWGKIDGLSDIGTSAATVTSSKHLLKTVLDKMNTLVCEMRDLKQSPQDPVYSKSKSRSDVEKSVRRIQALKYVKSELSNINSRSRAMISCYKGANKAFYSNHCDNPNKNGRKLTSILYLNEEWLEEYGGSLNIHPPKSLTDEYASGSLSYVSIAPQMGRLVLFWSDPRCPHEVSPVVASDRNRFAITLWFIDAVEKESALLAALPSSTVAEGPKCLPSADGFATALDTAADVKAIKSNTNSVEAVHNLQISNLISNISSDLDTCCVVEGVHQNDYFSWSITPSPSGDSHVLINASFKSQALWDSRDQISLDISEKMIIVSSASTVLLQVKTSNDISAFNQSSVVAKFKKSSKQMNIKVGIKSAST